MAQGKQSDQKMKPYLVYEFLMRYSDANHVVSANELVGYLQECGISAERRSIYKDIEETVCVVYHDVLIHNPHGEAIPRDNTHMKKHKMLTPSDSSIVPVKATYVNTIYQKTEKLSRDCICSVFCFLKIKLPNMLQIRSQQEELHL